MAQSEITIEGLKQLVASFNQLQKRKMNKIVREAMAPISERMANTARQNTSIFKEPTGRLKGAIKTRNRFVRRGAVYAADALVDAGSSRKDKNGAFYAHMVEFGHKTRSAGIIFGSSGFVAPRPFWEPAFRTVYGGGGQKAIKEAEIKIGAGVANHFQMTVPQL